MFNSGFLFSLLFVIFVLTIYTTTSGLYILQIQNSVEVAVCRNCYLVADSGITPHTIRIPPPPSGLGSSE